MNSHQLHSQVEYHLLNILLQKILNLLKIYFLNIPLLHLNAHLLTPAYPSNVFAFC